jgi:hypothetical protein
MLDSKHATVDCRSSVIAPHKTGQAGDYMRLISAQESDANGGQLVVDSHQTAVNDRIRIQGNNNRRILNAREVPDRKETGPRSQERQIRKHSAGAGIQFATPHDLLSYDMSFWTAHVVETTTTSFEHHDHTNHDHIENLAWATIHLRVWQSPAPISQTSRTSNQYTRPAFEKRSSPPTALPSSSSTTISLRKMTKSIIIIARLIIALCLLVKPVAGADGVKATASANYMELANLIFNPVVTGVTINGAVFSGDARQLGNYTATGTIFSDLPRSGVVLSSGKVIDVQEGRVPDTNFARPGDGELMKVLQDFGLTVDDAETVDASVLVFDISVKKAVDIDIAFVFGSGEYFFPLDDQFADVFGLFHGGTNIALFSNNDPVSIKTVNCGTTTGIPTRNCDQFIGNAGGLGTSLVGYTKTLIATLKLPVGTNQKVKIAIADGHQASNIDSAVFLSVRSFRPTAPTRAPTLQMMGMMGKRT